MSKLNELKSELQNLLQTANTLPFPAVRLFLSEFLRLINTYETTRTKRHALNMGDIGKSDETGAWHYLLTFVLKERLKRFNTLNTENNVELNTLVGAAIQKLQEIALALRHEYLPVLPLEAADLPADYKSLGNDLRKKIVYLRNRAWDVRNEKGKYPYILAAVVLWIYDQRSFIMQDLNDDQATIGRDGSSGNSNDKLHWYYVYPLDNSYQENKSALYLDNVPIHTYDVHFSNGNTSKLAAALKAFLAAPKHDRTPEKHPVLGDLLTARPLGLITYWEEAIRDNNETAFWAACQGSGQCVDVRLAYLYQNFLHIADQKALSSAQRDEVGIELQKALIGIGDVYSTESYTKTMTAMVANIENLNAEPELGDDFDIDEITGLNDPNQWCLLGAKGLELVVQELYYKKSNGEDIDNDLNILMSSIPAHSWKYLEKSNFSLSLFLWLERRIHQKGAYIAESISMALAYFNLLKVDSSLSSRLAGIDIIFDRGQNPKDITGDQRICLVAKNTLMELIAREVKKSIPVARGMLDKSLSKALLIIGYEFLIDYNPQLFPKNKDNLTPKELRSWLLFIDQFNKHQNGFVHPKFKEENSDFRKSFNDLFLAPKNDCNRLAEFLHKNIQNGMLRDWYEAVSLKAKTVDLSTLDDDDLAVSLDYAQCIVMLQHSVSYERNNISMWLSAIPVSRWLDLNTRLFMNFPIVQDAMITNRWSVVFQRLNQLLIDINCPSEELSSLVNMAAQGNQSLLINSLYRIQYNDGIPLLNVVINQYRNSENNKTLSNALAQTDAILKYLDDYTANKAKIENKISYAFSYRYFTPLKKAWEQNKPLVDRSADVLKCYRRLGWWQRRRMKDDISLQVVEQYSPQTEAECVAVLNRDWNEIAKEQAITRLLFKDWGKKPPTTIARMQRTWMCSTLTLQDRLRLIQTDLAQEQETWRFMFCRLTRKRYTKDVYKAIERSNYSEELAKQVVKLKSRLR